MDSAADLLANPIYRHLMKRFRHNLEKTVWHTKTISELDKIRGKMEMLEKFHSMLEAIKKQGLTKIIKKGGIEADRLLDAHLY